MNKMKNSRRKRQEKIVSYSHLTNSSECDIIWSYLTANAERTSHEQKQSIHKISEESAYQPQETNHRRGKHLVLQIRGTAQQGEDTLLLPDVPGQVLWLQTAERYPQNGFDGVLGESVVKRVNAQATLSPFTPNAKFGDAKLTILSRK